MQFIVIAYDDVDDQALSRRLAAREAHLKVAKEMHDNGKWLYASAILNNDGKMIGSVIVCDFPSQDDLQERWLNNEPYILGNVWKKIDIHRAQVAPLFAKT